MLAELSEWATFQEAIVLLLHVGIGKQLETILKLNSPKGCCRIWCHEHICVTCQNVTWSSDVDVLITKGGWNQLQVWVFVWNPEMAHVVVKIICCQAFWSCLRMPQKSTLRVLSQARRRQHVYTNVKIWQYTKLWEDSPCINHSHRLSWESDFQRTSKLCVSFSRYCT